MVPSAEAPTQVQPTVPAPPARSGAGLTPHEPGPQTGGPGGPPRPPKRPTGGSGGGGGGGDDFGPGDPNGDAARKRLTLIVAGIGVVVLIILFVVLSSSGNDDGKVSPTAAPAATETPQATPTAAETPTPAAATTPTATPAATATATPSSTTPATSPSSTGGVTIDGDGSGPTLSAGKVTKFTVKQGQTVSFQVTSPTAQEVHVHGYDNKYEVAAGETKSISFPAKITGIFEIEFEDTSTEIGELTVEP